MIVHLDLVMALSNGMEDYSEIGRIIDDCHTYITTFTSIQAHIASFSYLNDLWLDELHVIIRYALYKDQCNCSRGIHPPRGVHKSILLMIWVS